MRQDNNNQAAKTIFEAHKDDLGHGLLLKQYTDKVIDATPEQIETAARHSIPKVAPMFWTFRGMVFCGVTMLFIFGASFYYNAKRTAHKQRWLLRLAVYGIPLPWIASELGWVVAEYGRQPWTIANILPTHLSTSSVDVGQLYLSLVGFFVFYTALLVIELFLMLKYIRLGPSSLHTVATILKKKVYTMFDYETLRIIWWAILVFLVCGFTVMDGFDLGIGMLLPFLGKTDDERRVMLNTIGPTWEGNQTWLITLGGISFGAWSLVYATFFFRFVHRPIGTVIWPIFTACGF